MGPFHENMDIDEMVGLYVHYEAMQSLVECGRIYSDSFRILLVEWGTQCVEVSRYVGSVRSMREKTGGRRMIIRHRWKKNTW